MKRRRCGAISLDRSNILEKEKLQKQNQKKPHNWLFYVLLESSSVTHVATKIQVLHFIQKEMTRAVDLAVKRVGSLHRFVLRKHISHAGTEWLGEESHTAECSHCWWQAPVKEALASCLWSSHGGDSRLQTDRWASVLWSWTGRPQRCFTLAPPPWFDSFTSMCMCTAMLFVLIELP